MNQSHLRRATALAVVGLVALAFGPVSPASAASSLDVDASLTEALATTVAEERDTFAGVSVDDAAGKMTVSYSGEAGLQAAKTKLAKHTGVKVAGGKRSKIEFVEVKRSFKQLDAVRDQVKADPDLTKVIARHFVDVSKNVVSIGVTELTDAVQKAVTSKYGDNVTLHVAQREKRTSRTADWAPWGGGIRINANTGGCTAAFIIKNNADPTWRRAVTAGHCGPYGTNWYNNGVYVGWSVSSTLAQNGLDYAYVGGSTYMPWTYTAGPTSATGHAITGTYMSLVGRKFCTNGATSGEVCQGTVSAIDACLTFSDGITTCFLDILYSDFGGVMSRPGDSGGAVIAYSGGLKVGGIIIGGSNPTYFHSYHYLLQSGWSVAV